MILDRYLWSRLWHRWFLLLGVILIILYAIDFLAQIREYDHWPVLDVAQMIVYRLPILLDTALPYIAFLTVFFTFSGLQNANLFDVMRASGYSWRRIMRVAVFFALILGFFHTVVFDEIRARASLAYQDLLSSHGDYPANPFKGEEIWLKSVSPSETVFLQAKAIREGALQDVVLVILGQDNILKARLWAKRAEIQGDALLLNTGFYWISGVATPLPQEGVKVHWYGPSWETLLTRGPSAKTFLSILGRTLEKTSGPSVFLLKSHDDEARALWQGLVRPLSYGALAVLASVALLTSHHRTRSFVPFLVTALFIFVLHLGHNATMHWATQGLLPFWYASLWTSALLLFGSFLVLMRRTYGSV
jgi:lipopolysaccharide export LptBFGC system permease protein LptF